MRMTSLLACLVTLACLPPASIAAGIPEDTQVRISWDKVIRESKTTATFQIVVNPMLRRGSPLHEATFRALKGLECDRARLATWFPHPKLSVAELEPPHDGKIFWDASELDPIVADFFEATEGHGPVLNLNTTPQWMFETTGPVAYPKDPTQTDYGYLQGTKLRDPSMKEIASYYERLARWYAQGGFTDRFGRRHDSPHRLKIDYWEVLNEPDNEHQFSPEAYTALYDAVVGSLRPVLSQTKFVGISLASPTARPGYFEYFLNPRNHQPGIPLDAISYHFYAIPGADESPEVWQFTLFEQAERFLTAVRYINAIRDRLAPGTETHINEIGSVLPEDMIQMSKLDHRGPPAPDSYWALSSALFAYLYGELAKLGIEVAGMSQLLGYPGFFPNCSMIDWNTGKPNVRYWTLKLIRDNFGPGDRLVETSVMVPNIYGQGFITKGGERKLLLVNRRAQAVEITMPQFRGARIQAAGSSPDSKLPDSKVLLDDKLRLEGFAVTVVSFPAP